MEKVKGERQRETKTEVENGRREGEGGKQAPGERKTARETRADALPCAS